MIPSIKNSIWLVALVIALLSCSQGPTLQTYYVDNELKPGFTSIDVPTSFLNIEETSLTEEQKEAYESVDKLNMLAFVVSDSNRTEYETEVAKVKTILKDPKYQELIRGGNSTDGHFVVKYLGEETNIDELVLFGDSNDKGFAIIRVLGDNMNINKIMKLSSVLENADLGEAEIGKFAEMFK
ncbi:DUF4252 domain-containing protein [Mangrovimonas xylaniphaga]|uniref:DUF4252 domain-containing protein n=1 Tax=Mangrovimonas xylaniphaga TaxID=1645915 RepID=UPI0006B58F5D|nr:DUF4252 domain-containing protein [Mangrovimonas xylaniphaga]